MKKEGKDLEFLGNTKEIVQNSSEDFRIDFGRSFRKIQNGTTEGLDIAPLDTVGKGVKELRIWLDDGTYRAVYIAKFEDIVYVLHIFKKKTQKTPQRDIELAKKRLSEILEIRRHKNGK